MDDVTQLRHRLAELEADLDRVLATSTAGTAALVAQVASASLAGHMFALKSCGVACNEVENAAPTFTPSTETFFGLHLGTVAPAVGDHVLVVQIDGLWQFQA